jgi:hypothetical protein
VDSPQVRLWDDGGKMADRHSRKWRPTLRPDRVLYQRAQEALRESGMTMNDAFDELLLWLVGDRGEPPAKPSTSGGDESDSTDGAPD